MHNCACGHEVSEHLLCILEGCACDDEVKAALFNDFAMGPGFAICLYYGPGNRRVPLNDRARFDRMTAAEIEAAIDLLIVSRVQLDVRATEAFSLTYLQRLINEGKLRWNQVYVKYLDDTEGDSNVKVLLQSRRSGTHFLP